MKYILFCLTLILFGIESKSQVVTNPISFELFFGGGLGKDTKTGIFTENGSDILLSIGGGRNLGASLGYRFDNYVEVFLSLYDQKSELEPQISNGSGSFSKVIVYPKISYKIPFNKKHFINLGGGLRASLKNVMEIDASEIGNRAHNFLYYKNSFGPSAFIAYEYYFNKWLSFSLAYSYYYNKYKLNELISDGNTIDTSILDPTRMQYIDNLNGSGFGVFFGFKLHI
jgi:hypothetical protein